MEILKKYFRPIFFYSGLPILKIIYRRFINQQRIFILMYHRVDYKMPPLFEMCVRPDVFDEQIFLLKKHFEIVDLCDLNKIEPDTNKKKDLVVITFDDGYRDNYIHAFPIIKKYNIPATIFLATDYINTDQLLWYDKLAWILYMSSSIPDKKTLHKHNDLGEIYRDIEDFYYPGANSQSDVVRSIIAKLKNVPYKNRENILNSLAKICKLDTWPKKEDRVTL